MPASQGCCENSEMMSSSTSKRRALGRVSVPNTATEIATEACDLLGSGVCLQHQAARLTTSNQKSRLGSHNCSRVLGPKEVLGWDTERNRVMDP